MVGIAVTQLAIIDINPDYVTTRAGGQGAFREFSDLILNNQK